MTPAGGGDWAQVEIRYCSRLLWKSTEFCLIGGMRGERGEEQNFTLYEIFTMYLLNDDDIFHYFATEGCSHVDRLLKSLMNET